MTLLTTTTDAEMTTLSCAIPLYGTSGANGSNFPREEVNTVQREFLQKEPVDRLMDISARVMRAEADLPVLARNIPHMPHDAIVREVQAYHAAVCEVHEQLKHATGLVLAMERQISGNYGRGKRADAEISRPGDDSR